MNLTIASLVFETNCIKVVDISTILSSSTLIKRKRAYLFSIVETKKFYKQGKQILFIKLIWQKPRSDNYYISLIYKNVKYTSL